MSDREQPKTEPVALWPHLMMLGLAIVLMALLGRPCEMYRLKVTLTETGFPWTGTVCVPWPDGPCTCSTTDPTNPLQIREGTPARNPLARDEIKVEVVF